MRKILVVIFVVMLVPFAAQAFVVPEEVEVKYSSTSLAGPTSRVSLATKKDIKNLSGRIKGLEGQTSRLSNETAANSEAVSNMAENMNGLVNAVDNTAVATRNLTGRVGNVEKSLVVEAKNLGDQGVKNTALLCGVGALLALVGALILFAVFRSRKSILAAVADVNKNVTDTGEKVVREVKALDPLVIELEDVVGHRVKYNVPIVDNMYVTCYVPSTVTSPVADHTQIVRARMTDKGAVRRSVRKTMADYFTRLAANPNPTTEQDRQQKALVEHLIATGQLVVS